MLASYPASHRSTMQQATQTCANNIVYLAATALLTLAASGYGAATVTVAAQTLKVSDAALAARARLASARMMLDRRMAAGAGRGLQVWGQGDIQTLGSAYDGNLWTSYVGVDTPLTDRWLAGVSVARSGGDAVWRWPWVNGRLKTTLAAVHPYVQWSDGATSVAALAGAGWGEAEHVRLSPAAGGLPHVPKATGPLETAALGLRLGLVEVRRRLFVSSSGAQFGVRGDAAWAQLATEEGAEAVDALTARADRVRVGVAASRLHRPGGLVLSPFGEAHLRWDGGGLGGGLELAGGLLLVGGIVRIDAQARVLLHDYPERGAGVTLSLGDQNRPGWWLSVSPRWGDPLSAAALWQNEVYRRYLPGGRVHLRPAKGALARTGAPADSVRTCPPNRNRGPSQDCSPDPNHVSRAPFGNRVP